MLESNRISLWRGWTGPEVFQPRSDSSELAQANGEHFSMENHLGKASPESWPVLVRPSWRGLTIIAEVLALGLGLLCGHAGLELEVPHGQCAVVHLFPVLCVDAVDLDAEGVEVQGGDLGEDLAAEGVAAVLEDLLGDLEVAVGRPCASGCRRRSR